MKLSKPKYLKLTCTDTQTAWHKTPIYFCETCLNSEGHKHLKGDWFIKIEGTNKEECCAYAHVELETENE